jgi:hypothetical protein
MKELSLGIGIVAIFLWTIAEHGLPVPRAALNRTVFMIVAVFVLNWVWP